MSHYGVNAGIPKTLIQHLIRWVIATDQLEDQAGGVLEEILGQEISPELVPAAEGEGPQSTEAVIGPYALQDFTLFQVLRYGFPPSRIAFLAWHAWRDASAGPWPPQFPEAAKNAYDLAAVRKWLRVFLVRFFAQSQFKRSALPNSPKVVSGGSLSPRGDWRAPSDGNANVWLAELDAKVPER
jgi:NAD+ synthase (glutamine-hydrolysing)